MMDMSANNGTVMIVDDTPGNLALLSDTLSEAHYRVLVATDGQSALEQIQYIKPYSGPQFSDSSLRWCRVT